jgi:hypothetical protein
MTQETQLPMQILATLAIQYTATSPPSHHVQQKRFLECKAPNWKEWAFTDGSCIKQRMYLSLLELESTTLNPANLHPRQQL